MTSEQLAPYTAHLRSTAEIFGVLTDPEVSPRPGSLADQELAEARTLSLGDRIWGENPVRTAYAYALMSYTVALDEGLAMAAVISGGVRTAIPAVVLARSITEVCSQAWWLLEPRIGAGGRVERLQCLRLRSAIKGEGAAEADGIDQADWHEYTETQTQVLGYSRKLGLDPPRRDGYAYACGCQRMASVSRMVQPCSAMSGWTPPTTSIPALPMVRSSPCGRASSAAKMAARYGPSSRSRHCKGRLPLLRALYSPAARLSDLFGLDRPPGQDDWIDEHAGTGHAAEPSTG